MNVCVLNQQKVDDKNQQIKVTISQVYKWRDPDIHVNTTHPYWKGKSQGLQRRNIRLNSEFVEECLWTPKLQFLSTAEMSIWNPSPTSTTDSKMDTFLTYNSFLAVSTFSMKLTIDCNMEFINYPFDRQVRNNI